MTAIGSVFTTARPCIRCGEEYTPKRPSARDRGGVYSEFCSVTCQRKSIAKAGYDSQLAVRESSRPPSSTTPKPKRKGHPGQGRSVGSGPLISAGTGSPFARRLVGLRANRSWTREDLAARIGVSSNTITNWELDRTDVSAKWLSTLAQLFEVSMDWLYGAETK